MLSYCVKCGVELDASAKKCALCSTPVINPELISLQPEEKPFADTVQIPKGIKKRFIAFVISVVMLIPNIVMFFLNVFFIKEGFWSIYVLVASLLVWTLFVFPVFSEKRHPFLLWAFDTAAVSVFFYVILRMHSENMWAPKCALAVIAMVSVSVLVSMLWMTVRKRHWTSVTVLILLELTVISVLSGAVTSYFSGNYNFFVVGVVIALCAFILMLFFIYCNRSKHIRAWLNKVFYI